MFATLRELIASFCSRDSALQSDAQLDFHLFDGFDRIVGTDDIPTDGYARAGADKPPRRTEFYVPDVSIFRHAQHVAQVLVIRHRQTQRAPTPYPTWKRSSSAERYASSRRGRRRSTLLSFTIRMTAHQPVWPPTRPARAFRDSRVPACAGDGSGPFPASQKVSAFPADYMTRAVVAEL